MEGALARWAGGDPSAFADILREHQSMVFSIAYYFLHDRSVAEDVSQEVFLRLYQNLRSIESPVHLVLWLRRVTSRACIDQARRSAARPAVAIEDAPEPAETTPPSDPMLARRLRRIVASLPEKARMIIILRYQEELDLAEIAAILEIPLNTVKSRLQRAQEILREKLTASIGVNRHEISG
jgi:RNA polymerase sigma-70 factor (ECF subfamily)